VGRPPRTVAVSGGRRRCGPSSYAQAEPDQAASREESSPAIGLSWPPLNDAKCTWLRRVDRDVVRCTRQHRARR
jgi:hypothetical protein